MKLKNEMKNDYRNRRGKVGAYKGAEVYIIEREEYDPQSAGTIYVIADDGMKMVLNNKVIGVLSSTGNVSDVKPYLYMKVEVATPFEVHEDELTIEIPSGYFESFSGVVDEFFKTMA